MALLFYLQASFSEHFYGLQRVFPGRSPRLVLQLAAALVPQLARILATAQVLLHCAREL